jgi:hypothetical protein
MMYVMDGKKRNEEASNTLAFCCSTGVSAGKLAKRTVVDAQDNVAPVLTRIAQVFALKAFVVVVLVIIVVL